MFTGPGIELDDVAWIQRDQFVYYVEMARSLGDVDDWDSLREDLAGALVTAFGLDTSVGDTMAASATEGQAEAAALLDAIRTHHDPVTDWPRFMDALWQRRRSLRDDL